MVLISRIRRVYRGSAFRVATTSILRYNRPRGQLSSEAIAVHFDIIRRQAPYTDPATDLRYHDKSVYELIKGLVRSAPLPFPRWPLTILLAPTIQSASAAKEYLSARGVNPIVR
jgi:hypothetical protein